MRVTDEGGPTSPDSAVDRLRMRIPPAVRRRLTLGAPFFFLVVALLRNLLETKFFAVRDSYSYFTLMHHLAWYASAMLAILLVVHLVLSVPVVRLVWLVYGSVVLFLPIVFAVVTGERLRMEYLKGSPAEILTHVATFSLTYRRDWPMAVEMIVIFIGMGVVGYVYRRSWRRAVALAVAVYLTIATLGLAWFNVARTTSPIFPLDTALRRAQPLLAMSWSHVATGFLLLVLWRAGAFSAGRQAWRRAAAFGAWTWVVWIVVVWSVGWFRRPFDIAATALPLVFAMFLAARLVSRDRRVVATTVWIVLFLAWGIQVLAIGPTAVHQQRRLLRRRVASQPRVTGAARRAPPLPAATASPGQASRD